MSIYLIRKEVAQKTGLTVRYIGRYGSKIGLESCRLRLPGIAKYDIVKLRLWMRTQGYSDELV